MRNFTISLFISASLLATTAVPTKADDAARLILGIGGAILGEALKNGQRSNQGKRSNGRDPSRDQMIGRVGEEPKKQRPRSNVRTGAAAAAATALVLPTVGPVIAGKPTEAEMVSFEQAQAESPISEGNMVPMYDENGQYWGDVSIDQAEKIAKAQDEFGMKPSVAIAAISGLPQPKPLELQPVPQVQQAPEPATEQPAEKPIETAEPEPAKPIEQPVQAVQEPEPTVAEAATAEAIVEEEKKQPTVDLEPEKPKRPLIDL